MYVIIAGLLILLCVSNFQIIYNYYKGVKPYELPKLVQTYVRNRTVDDIKEALVDFVTGFLNLLIVVATPLMYTLSVLYNYVYKLYKAVLTQLRKVFPYL